MPIRHGTCFRLRSIVLLCAAAILFAVPARSSHAADKEHMTIAGVDLGYASGDCYPDTEESMALTGSVECMAFARYCQSMVYGVNDFNAPEKFRDIVGKKSPEECTVENLKRWFMGCAPTTHLRCPGASKPMHSMSIAETCEDGVRMIHGNWYRGNIVAETKWSWEKFADQVQQRGGIVYAKSYIGGIPEPTTAPPTELSTTDEFDGELVGITGDVNDDGRVNTKDARLILRYAARLSSLTELQKIAADADGNGKVTASDARRILRVSAKLETLF